MRALFKATEKSQYVSDSVVVHDENKAAKQQASSVEVTDEQAAGSSTKKSNRQKKVKKVLSAQEQRLLNRKRAAVTLAASVLIGGRWYVANQNPTYPKGEGVYVKTTTPEWGKLKQPNAATFYMAATDALDINAIFSKKHGRVRQAAFIMEEPASVQKPYVQRAQPALTLLRQGMQYPYVSDFQTNYFKSDPNTGRGLSRPVPNFIAQREMARLLAAEANVRASEGNYAGAMESSIDAIRFGVDIGQGHSLIDGMIGVLIQGIGTQAGVKHVAGLTAPEARAAASRLEATVTAAPSFTQIMTQEREMIYETMQTVFHEGNAGGLIAEINGTTGNGAKSVAGKIAYGAVLMYYTKQGLVNDYASQMDQILVRGKMPYNQAVQLPPLQQSSNPFVRMAVPNSERAQRGVVTKAAWNQVFLAKLAIQAYRGEHHNALPSSLEELTTGANPYLSTVPNDPFSVSGKGPLRYNPKTGDVYSVGVDGADNGNTGDDNADLYK